MKNPNDSLKEPECELCTHPKVREINQDLRRDPHAADYYAEVYGVDPALLFRHGVCIQSVLLTHIHYLETSANALQDRARALLGTQSNVPSYLRSAQSAITTAVDLRGQALKLRGYHASNSELNKSPAFQALKKELARALAPYPDALQSVLHVFVKAEGEGK